MIEIQKYNSDLKHDWNDFLLNSKNGSFLFSRDFVEYHSDRFEDHSLIFYRNGKISAIMVASIKDGVLTSHAGLTYGGFVTSKSMNIIKMKEIYDQFISHCKTEKITKVIYKAIPHIYHAKPSEEDLYVLFLNKAKLIKREVSSTIPLTDFTLPGNKRRGANKARENDFIFKETSDFEEFFKLVNQGLNNKYNVSAVHTHQEMEKLKRSFPKNIKLFGAYIKDELTGGALMFENRNLAHAQYIASTDKAKRMRVYDFMMEELTTIYRDFTWFDFGISTEDGGLTINEGLLNQKNEYGASAVNYDTYEILIEHD